MASEEVDPAYDFVFNSLYYDSSSHTSSSTTGDSSLTSLSTTSITGEHRQLGVSMPILSDAQRNVIEQTLQKASGARHYKQVALHQLREDVPRRLEDTSGEDDEEVADHDVVDDEVERLKQPDIKKVRRESKQDDMMMVVDRVEGRSSLQQQSTIKEAVLGSWTQSPIKSPIKRAKVTGLAKKNIRPFHHAEDVDPDDDEGFDKDFHKKKPLTGKATSKRGKTTTTITARKPTRSTSK